MCKAPGQDTPAKEELGHKPCRGASMLVETGGLWKHRAQWVGRASLWGPRGPCEKVDFVLRLF